MNPIMPGYPVYTELSLAWAIAVAIAGQPVITAFVYQVKESLCWLGVATAQGLNNSLIIKSYSGGQSGALPVNELQRQQNTHHLLHM